MNEAVRGLKPGSEMILLEHLPFETDEGIASRTRIGLIVLATDYTIEHEWRQIMTPLKGVALYQSRISNSPQITPETLRAMEPLHRAGRRTSFFPVRSSTSSPMAAPRPRWRSARRKVFEHIRSVRPRRQMHDAHHGRLRGLQGLRRQAHRTADALPRRCEPYRRFLHHRARIRGAGLRLFQRGERWDRRRHQPRIDPQGVEAIKAKAKLDAVFVSCTSVRLAEAAAAIEAEIGLPVTSSNHAMAWHALRLGGVNDKLPQWGRLFTL